MDGDPLLVVWWCAARRTSAAGSRIRGVPSQARGCGTRRSENGAWDRSCRNVETGRQSDIMKTSHLQGATASHPSLAGGNRMCHEVASETPKCSF